MRSRRLEDHPQLWRWFASHREVRESDDPVTYTLYRLCCALSAEDSQFLPCLEATLSHLLTVENPASVVDGVERIMAQSGAPLAEFFTEALEFALLQGCGGQFHDLMAALAAKSKLVTFYFLAAWMALNLDQLEDCINHCELVTTPFAPITTLHGQALLDLGEADEAIDVLQIAVKLAPEEPLAWFQLAKAFHLRDRNEEALAALRRLRRILPKNGEVCLMMVIVVAAVNEADPALCEEAWNAIMPFAGDLTKDCVTVSHMFNLAMKSGRQEYMTWVIDNANRRRRSSLSPSFIQL